MRVTRSSAVWHRWRERLRDDRGASALELAIIAPSLLVMIFLVIQVALYLYGRSVALQAAREGVSIVRLAQDQQAFDQVEPGAMEQTQNFAAAVGRQSLVGPTATATSDYGTTGAGAGTVSVTVQGRVVSLLGFPLSVAQTANGTVERFSPDTP